MHSKLDDVLSRQRTYGLRDWLIGLVALVVVLVHIAGFSGGAWLPADSETAKAEPVSAVELIHHHTAQVCGDSHKAVEDLSC